MRPRLDDLWTEQGQLCGEVVDQEFRRLRRRRLRPCIATVATYYFPEASVAGGRFVEGVVC